MTSSWRFDAIGTAWQIDTDAPLEPAPRHAVTTLIDEFDRTWSRFRDDSVVSRLAGGGEAPAPADAAAMFELYATLGDATDGAVNPLVGESLQSLGYDAAYTLAGGPAVPAPAWRDVLSWTPSLALDRPGVIDVGAVGKGRLVDLVFELLRDEPGIVVDASGDLRTGSRELRVALEHPYDASRAIGVATISDGALCGSATNRRSWGAGLHHVLDARTGVPVDTVASTWVMHPHAMVADGLATALFFDGGPEAASETGASWVRMFTDGRAQWHRGVAPFELFS